MRRIPPAPAALRAIMDAPRVTQELPTPEQCLELSRAWRRAGSEFVLRPLQVYALMTAWAEHGLFGVLGLGEGKTPLSYLLGRAWGARRVLIIVPAPLRGKTAAEFELLAQHFDPQAELLLHSYHDLSNNHDLVHELAPDAIVCDEAEAFKDEDSGRTRRFLRYCDDQTHVPLAMISATYSNSSIFEYAHIINRTLKSSSPCLLPYPELAEMAARVDRSTRGRPSGPGPLLHWASPEQLERADTGFEAARTVGREVWGERLRTTPGVVTSVALSTDAPLTLRRRRYAPPARVLDALEVLEATWHTPGGVECTTLLEKRLAGLQLALDFCYVPIVPPPLDWRLARRDWGAAVRYAIHTLRRELDTEGDVVAALGELPVDVGAAYRAWKREAALYDYQVRPQLLSGTNEWCVAPLVEGWLERHPGGLVWVEHIFVGDELARRLKLPYYHQKARCAASKRFAKDHPPGLPAILAQAACRKGLNLQAHAANLFLCPPDAQAIGRTHRSGQLHGVTADFAWCAEVQKKAIASAQAGAQYEMQKFRTPSGLALEEIVDGEVLAC